MLITISFKSLQYILLSNDYLVCDSERQLIDTTIQDAAVQYPVHRVTHRKNTWSEQQAVNHKQQLYEKMSWQRGGRLTSKFATADKLTAGTHRYTGDQSSRFLKGQWMSIVFSNTSAVWPKLFLRPPALISLTHGKLLHLSFHLFPRHVSLPPGKLSDRQVLKRALRLQGQRPLEQ